MKRDGVKKAYGDRLLFEDMNFRLPPGGIVGVIGPNGAGKTTLFRMITGQEKAGCRDRFVSEKRSSSPMSIRAAMCWIANKTVWEEISDGLDNVQLGSRQVNSRAYVARFNFSGSDQQKKVGTLVRWRTQSRSSGEDAEGRRERAAAGRTDERSRREYAARSRRSSGEFCRLRRGHQLTTAGFWIASPLTFSRSKATAASSGSKGTIRITKPIAALASALPPISPIGSSTAI